MREIILDLGTKDFSHNLNKDVMSNPNIIKNEENKFKVLDYLSNNNTYLIWSVLILNHKMFEHSEPSDPSDTIFFKDKGPIKK